MKEQLLLIANLMHSNLSEKMSIIVVCDTLGTEGEVLEYLRYYSCIIEAKSDPRITYSSVRDSLIDAWKRGAVQILLVAESHPLFGTLNIGNVYDKSRIVRVIPVGAVSADAVEFIRAQVRVADKPKKNIQFDTINERGPLFPSWMGKYPRANASWTREEDVELLSAFRQSRSLAGIAEKHGRSRVGIAARLNTLGIATVEYDMMRQRVAAKRVASQECHCAKWQQSSIDNCF